jgi:hypothetical protein
MMLDDWCVFAKRVVVVRLQFDIVPEDLVFKTINFQINFQERLANFIWGLNFK